MRNGVATPVEPVVLPQRAGGRDEARTLVDTALPDTLAGLTVAMDGTALVASAPSYMDELVKAILVERGAARLVITGLPARAAGFARTAAQRRQVADQLDLVASRP